MSDSLSLSTSQPSVYFKTSVIEPEFRNSDALWVKSAVFELNKAQNDAKFKFYKIGKTFGFFTKRILVIRKHYMAYYENEGDTEIKGFCSLRNLYVGFFIVGEKYRYLVQFTNFTSSIQMYFEERADLAKLKSYISKYCIQLKFDSKFNALDALGAGSFAKVFKAKRKIQDNQQFAVKMISKLDKNKNKTKEAVKQQRLALQLLNNDNFSRIYEFFEDTNYFYFIIEYIPGKSLMELLKQDYHFQVSVKQQILKGILEGLKHCHAKKIIHRDLKPQNIIVSQATFKPKIIDLGLSLSLKPGSQLKNFKRCGTMGYIAPEIIKNHSESRKTYGCKADMFSFGIIAHMLLMGNNPLKGKTQEETMQLNKSLDFQLDKQRIIKEYGQTGLEFIQCCLSIEEDTRLSAEQALDHIFLKQEILEHSKHQETHKDTQHTTHLNLLDQEESEENKQGKEQYQ